MDCFAKFVAREQNETHIDPYFIVLAVLPLFFIGSLILIQSPLEFVPPLKNTFGDFSFILYYIMYKFSFIYV
ncbi:hypothetical protein POAN111098_04670 [Polynucleobacter antarcticus]|uniref:Uncharacterized protein n=1 Tax=Polynucleobacter antarcticus TaxID=1743162 RepID=A0A6M9PSL3_9BURK|nr:hypothetical protein DCO16_01535 [Polynucleobacter antarcticus]